MDKEDMQILQALYHGNHLSDKELERALKLQFLIKGELKRRIKK